jgi:uncharacterized protein (DUF1330 family)
MPVYIVNAYNVDDFETFKNYPPYVRDLLKKYGAKVLAMETNPKTLEGKAKTMNAIIEFPSEEAVDSFYNDPEYQKIISIRHASTSSTTMIMLKQFSAG